MNFNIDNIEEKELAIRDLYLYYLENDFKEDKPLLLFLHGFPDNAYCWSHQIEAFKEDYHLIAPFSYGTHPRKINQIIPERFQSENYAEDIITLLNHVDTTGSRKVMIIAHDMGGVVADKLSEMIPDRIKGLLYLNSMGLHQYAYRQKKPYQLIKSYYMYIFQVPKFADAVFRVATKTMLNKIYDWGELPKDDAMRTHGREVFVGINLYRQYFKEIFEVRKTERKRIEIPTAFIWGERDRFLEIPTHTEVETFYTNAELRVLDMNHWIHRSAPERINELLSKTFNKWLS